MLDNVATTLSEINSNAPTKKLAKVSGRDSALSDDTLSGEEDWLKNLATHTESGQTISLDQIAANKSQAKRRNALFNDPEEPELVSSAQLITEQLQASLKLLYLERTARAVEPVMCLFAFYSLLRGKICLRWTFCVSFFEYMLKQEPKLLQRILRQYPLSGVVRQAVFVINKLKRKQFNVIMRKSELVPELTAFQVARRVAMHWMTRLNRYRKEKKRWNNLAHTWSNHEVNLYYIKLSLPDDLQHEPEDTASPVVMENWRFRRLLFLNLHPNQDYELQLPYLKKALQHINSGLASENLSTYLENVSSTIWVHFLIFLDAQVSL
ncbi:hypothetical protein Ciccas_004771 [Cichlidogyrus casuarinus]|uniref:Uncharacterized protein n=1 Tax=Cichlidogyrus casuarinus TaxID=1844966 RepID=A0ABD2QE19_9PLAT